MLELTDRHSIITRCYVQFLSLFKKRPFTVEWGLLDAGLTFDTIIFHISAYPHCIVYCLITADEVRID